MQQTMHCSRRRPRAATHATAVASSSGDDGALPPAALPPPAATEPAGWVGAPFHRLCLPSIAAQAWKPPLSRLRWRRPEAFALPEVRPRESISQRTQRGVKHFPADGLPVAERHCDAPQTEGETLA